MNLLRRLGILAIAALTALSFNACDEESTIEPIADVPSAPESLMATSIDSNTIHIMWEAPSDLDQTLFQSYTVTWFETNDDGSTENATTMDAGTPFPLTGLSHGVVYTIRVTTNYNNGESSTESAEIMWSPAYRFTVNDSGVDPIRIHEGASSLGSGLDLYVSDEFGDKYSNALTTGKIEDWNLGFRIDGSSFLFGSASTLGYNASPDAVNSAEISGYKVATTLEQVFDSEGLDAGDFSLANVDLATVDLDGEEGIVLYVRNDEDGNGEYNYAKVLVKAPGGTFLQGTSPNRYVEVVVSYQEAEGVPYAKR